MRPLIVSVAVLVTLATARCGEYCDDFENGELGPFWESSELDSRGHWRATSYRELSSSIADFPPPAQGDMVAYLTSNDNQIYMYARLQMAEEYLFPAGSTISFRYWLRTDYPGSGTLEVRSQIGDVEEKQPFISLTETSGPNNTDWLEVSGVIPESSHKQKIIIFGSCATHAQNNIAVDDVRICGPQGLDQMCYPVATTTELVTTTEYPTTENPTTENFTTETPTTSASPATPGEYCDDFESDDFGLFWRRGLGEIGGRWESASYLALRQEVPDFPAPAAGDTVLYLTPSAGSAFVAGRVEMTAELIFPEGSRLTFRYWLRSQWVGTATLFVKRQVGQQEDAEPLLNLSYASGPDNDQWQEATVDIPADDRPAKIIISASGATSPMDNIAIDDILVYGPTGLDHQCAGAAIAAL